jgi:uncharacterized repeat protein (TIGR03803 family)
MNCSATPAWRNVSVGLIACGLRKALVVLAGASPAALWAQALGPSAFTVLRSFTDSVPSFSSGLIQASNGLLYGTTPGGGATGNGTVFRTSLDGTSFTVVRSMSSSDAWSPTGVIQGSDGKLYGTSALGGAGSGTVFTMNTDGTGFAILHSFVSSVDGASPSGLIEGAGGTLYGATPLVQGLSLGTLFKLNRDGSGYTVLRSMAAPDGTDPTVPIQAPDGKLYGTATTGGSSGSGTIFRINPDGTGFTVLHQMGAADGVRPNGRLLLASNGKLYGTAVTGGASGLGTIYRMELDGTGYTVMRSLSFADGAVPTAGLIQARNGALYGVARTGGAGGNGAIFRINPADGAFSTVWSFGVTDGKEPNVALIQGGDLKLYGLTVSGGSQNFGTIFSYSLLPQLTSAGSASATVGQAFLYQITAANSPGFFSAANLPSGLTINLSNGLISGTPATAGVIGVVVGATNDTGSSNGTLVLSVAKGTAGVTLGNLAQNFDGSAKPASVTTPPPGLAVTTTYNGSSTVPVNVGGYSVTATVLDPNYIGSATGTLIIAKNAAGVTLSGLTQIFDGATKSATVKTTPAGLAFTTTYNGSSTAPTNPGVYAVVATIVDPNYTGAATGTLTILSAPAIGALPVDQTTVVGAAANLTVTATGSAPLAYQWQRLPSGSTTWGNVADGSDYSGTATAALGVLSPTLAMNGDLFRVIVTNAAGTATSGASKLTVLPNSRLRNFSIGANVTPAQPLTVGFVTNGGPRQLLLRAIGPGLAPFVAKGTVLAADPSLTLFSGTSPVASNNDWGGLPSLATAFTTVGAFGLSPNSLDAALLAGANGNHTAQFSTLTSGFGLIEAYDLGTDTAVRVVNFSALYLVGAGNETLTAGFVVAGTGPKTLLIRGIGPGLKNYGVINALDDPRIDLFDGSSNLLLSNDDWPAGLAPVAAGVGAFALAPGGKDAALQFTALPGAYTVQLTSVNGATGLALIEIYEVLP